MTTEIRDRRETGSVFNQRETRVECASSNFHITRLDGVFDAEPDQTYFWTEEWQQGEREADEDIRLGRFSEFDSADEAIEHLRGLRE